MRKPKLSNITGTVALSYLVLIPAAGIFLWNRFNELDKEVSHLNRVVRSLRGDQQFEEEGL